MKKIFVLGGDGFCGWPTALFLSNCGYEITVIDNLSRRKIDVELNTNSLTPIATIEERVKAWYEVSGKKINFVNIDLANDYESFVQILTQEKPDTIVHFAEQRAAPYSMKSSYTKRYTVSNNTNVTNNVLCAVVETGLDIHIVHLGTMGVYGYGTAGAAIPEGYLTVKIQNHNDEWVDKEILHPVNPGSIYHTTKTIDQLLFFYFNKNDKIRITDLHQGIVWGTETSETKLDERLINRFDYDGDYGTVLNRFLMQAAIGYPLTIHGTGGQTRAFININDTVKCVKIAIENPPQKGERVEIFNQVTETHRVRDLASMVSVLTKTPIENLENPRNEDSENDLKVENSKFMRLGLNPIKLNESLIDEITSVAQKYSKNCDKSKIPCVSKWRQ